MGPGRWRRVEEIFHRASARPTDNRRVFVEQECAGDAELLAEVERMLAVEAEASEFLEAPAIELTAQLLAAAEPLAFGSRLGPYEILSLLGSGGMGEVYKARDTRLNRLVAIKLLPAFAPNDAERRKRLLREARAASVLNHPNIVTLHDIISERGRDGLVMECLEGRTLDDKIAGKGLPLRDVLQYAIQIVNALAAAHAAGIVHRDIKPGNIMVTDEESKTGTVKVLDFGLAKVQSNQGPESDTSSVTQLGAIAGTIAYMSPEQAEGHSVDARSDLFSFGSVLYQMLTGRPPFCGSSHLSTLSSILRDPPASLKTVRTDAPVELDRILRHCMEKDRNARYPSAAELYRDLVACEERVAAEEASSRSTLLRPKVMIAALALLALLVAGIAWGGLRAYRYRWVRTVALPEIALLADKENSIGAFRLAQKVDQYVPNEPELQRLRRYIWVPISIHTEPPGADVWIRDYAADRQDWAALGKTPVVNLRLPAGNFCLRITKPGFVEVEGTVDAVVKEFRRKLQPVGSAPPGMVFVPLDMFTVPHTGRVKAGAFWLDKYEVTNHQFKEFVDKGGYRKRDHWKQPFIDNGRRLSWEEAMARFVDSTGQPGPSTWELGSYTEGHSNYPVGGVSWYEAAAYAEFAGKALPTVYHWAAAADFAHFSTILTVSNFRGEGPAPVGSYPGVGRFGTYDMAGNVSEWCWNLSGDRRSVRGGAWADPDYMYTGPEAAAPFARGPTHGFRCAKYTGLLPEALTGPLDICPSHDPGKDKPVGDDAFRAYRSIYTYDRIDLRSRIESVDDSSPWWRKERVSFDAAYANDRIVAFLFLPRNTAPPYQTILFFPGGTAQRERTSDNLELRRLDFLIRTGHAVVYPVYKGMYERHLASDPTGPHERRDLKIQWIKDIGRSIDYIETRADLDHGKLVYYGASVGAVVGPIALAVDPRFKTGILQGGGLDVSGPDADPPGEVQPVNFLPRVKVPVLMMNGRDDFLHPLEQSQIPMFRLIGTPEKDKRRVVFDSGHSIPRPELIKEMLAWLDHNLGRVKPNGP